MANSKVKYVLSTPTVDFALTAAHPPKFVEDKPSPYLHFGKPIDFDIRYREVDTQWTRVATSGPATPTSVCCMKEHGACGGLEWDGKPPHSSMDLVCVSVSVGGSKWVEWWVCGNHSPLITYMAHNIGAYVEKVKTDCHFTTTPK